MSTRTRRGPSGSLTASVIGLAIIIGVVLAPGTPRIAKNGSDYLDGHPSLQMPLLAALVVFIAVALLLQNTTGFAVSALIGLAAGAIVLVSLYSPARHAVPGLGDTKPTCKTGQVLNSAGHCVTKKAGR